LTEAAVKPRPKKAKVETYEVDGRTVTLTQVPVDLERGWTGENRPAMRGKWEIALDGVHVGYAFYPKGVGNPWVFTALTPKAVGDYYSFGDPFYVLAWEPPVGANTRSDYEGCYTDYNGLQGVLTPLNPWRGDLKPDTDEQWFKYDADWRWDSREQIAQWVPRFAANGRLPDKTQVVALIEADKVERENRRLARIAEEQEREADRARWAAERAEQAAQAEQLRKDTLEGLMDIQTKHGALLTNFEAAALAEAIKAVSR
jgi:hypothetical protein